VSGAGVGVGVGVGVCESVADGVCESVGAGVSRITITGAETGVGVWSAAGFAKGEQAASAAGPIKQKHKIPLRKTDMRPIYRMGVA
jgi:hypothetical protein